MGLQIGIVGLANVGKSTLFNALLKRQQALAANYPFATIEPNVGVVPVPDARLKKLAEVVAQERTFSAEGAGSKEVPLRVELPPEVPATVEFVDIAGLVAGAHKGEGLGNQFLAHVREVDLIALVLRDFSDPDVVQTGEGLVEDYKTLKSELILKDLETVQAQSEKRKANKDNPKLKLILEKLLSGFDEGRGVIEILDGEELMEVRELWLLTAKPTVVVVNTGELELEDRAREGGRVSYAERLGVGVDDIVVVSAKIESEIATLDEIDAKMFMDDMGIVESGLERLIKGAYTRLGLMSFLTAGEKEVRAWPIPAGTPAVRASSVIHSDFENKFIKAEVVGFEDFVNSGGWKKCRSLGKVRLEGRDYIVQDGDVIEFKIGA